MLQRHVGPRLSNSDYPASGDGGVAAGATVMPTRSLLARDNDPMDYDMPEDLNAAMLISPRTHPTTETSLVPPMHDMIIDQDTKTRKGDDIMFLQPPNLCGPAGVEAPATSRRGPRKRLYSGHHRRSTKSDGARPPDRK